MVTVGDATAVLDYYRTHDRTGWCGRCDREVPISTAPLPPAHRLWFCKVCGHALGQEPK